MTCIVGLVHGSRVYIGGDSCGAAVERYDVVSRKDPKVFKVGKFLFGYTSSFRMGQLIRFSFKPPKNDCKNDYEYLCTKFVDEIRSVYKNGGYLTVDNSVETGGIFLLGYNGQLYTVEDDFDVGMANLEYYSIGAGANYALGAMYQSGLTKKRPQERIKNALDAAATFNGAVMPPYKILWV